MASAKFALKLPPLTISMLPPVELLPTLGANALAEMIALAGVDVLTGSDVLAEAVALA